MGIRTSDHKAIHVIILFIHFSCRTIKEIGEKQINENKEGPETQEEQFDILENIKYFPIIVQKQIFKEHVKNMTKQKRKLNFEFRLVLAFGDDNDWDLFLGDDGIYRPAIRTTMRHFRMLRQRPYYDMLFDANPFTKSLYK